MRNLLLWLALGVALCLLQPTLAQDDPPDIDADDDKTEKSEEDELISKSSKHQLSAGGNDFSLRVRDSVRLEGKEFRIYEQHLNSVAVLGSQIVTEVVGRSASNNEEQERAISENLVEFSMGSPRSLASATKKTQGQLRAACVAARNGKAGVDGFVPEEEYLHKTAAGTEHLVVIATYESEDETQRGSCIVDVHSGVVLESWDPRAESTHLTNGDGGNTKTRKYRFGTGSGAYAALPTDKVGTTCWYRTPRISVINARNGHPYYANTVHSVTCGQESADAINGAFSPANDVFFAADKYVSMMKTKLGVTKWMPGNITSKLVVHTLRNYENAFWSPSRKLFAFGDGASRFYPLTVWDVVFHEMAHAFTNTYSNLIYSGHSGCMNEAFSDMTGIAGVAFSKGLTTPTDWSIGRDMYKANRPLRYMDDPTRDGRSIKHISTYRGQNVHYCSGIYNHAFYQLVKVQGMPIFQAWKLFAAANMLQWTRSSTMQQGACGVSTMAAALGFSEADKTKVGNAFNVVGLKCGASTGTPTGTMTCGKTLSNLSGSWGRYHHHSVVVPAAPAGKKYEVYVESWGGRGDMDLFVQFNRQAGNRDYKWKASRWGNRESIRIFPAAAGTYHIMRKAWWPYSGASLRVRCNIVSPPVVPAVENCVETAVPSTSYRQMRHYMIAIPAGVSRAVFTTRGVARQRDADLYVMRGALATRSRGGYLGKSWRAYNDETVTLTSPPAGTYYSMVYAYRAFSNVKIKVCYEKRTGFVDDETTTGKPSRSDIITAQILAILITTIF